MRELDRISGTIAGRIMSFIHGTNVYRETAIINGINFDDVAESVKAKMRGSRTEVEIEINDVVFRIPFRKNHLMLDREVWNIDNIVDIQRMLRYLQDKVVNQYTLIAAAGTL